MLRIIRENSPVTGLKLFGINFGDPNKKDPMTALQQWEKLETSKSEIDGISTDKIRYPIKMDMEIPKSISFIAHPGNDYQIKLG